MAKLRKALIAGVGAITILSMSMLMVPLQVGAAAQAGDLIKMNGLSSVYYLGSDGKRYVFPNESTYFSWYSDFSKVVTIPQAELESYPLGKNVTVRPGTKLVKITTNPKVYAVTPGGVLLAIPSETVAATLWGANWAKRVIDVPDAFFTNYTIGSGTVAATAYPAGSIVKFGTAADVYYINADGTGSKIATEAAFLANGFNWNDVVTSTLTAPTAGTAITAKDTTIADTSSGAGGTIYAGGSGLTVALSGDTAASRNIPSLSTLVPFTTVNLTASSDGAVTVDQMVFTRKGTGATTDFDGGYLYSGDSLLSTKRSVNSSDNTITFTALNLSIPAGATKAVTLKMNAVDAAAGNHYFQLTSASNVSTNGATVSGSFPVAGNLMTYSSGVNAATITVTGGSGSSNLTVGESNVILGDFTLANNALEDVNIYRIRLKQEGTAVNDAIANFSLDLDGTVVKSGVAMADKYVDFVLDTPFLLKKSTTITATYRGDVSTDVNKTIQLYLKDSNDFDARGTAYGDFYSANLTNSFTTGTGNLVTIKGSEINVSTDGPAAADYKENSKNVILANVKINTANTDVNFDTLRFVLTAGGAVSGNLQNIVLADATNNISYSVADPASSTSANLDFTNVYLKKGVQYNFQLRGDIPDNENAGATYYVSLNTATGQTGYFQDADQTAVCLTSGLPTSCTGTDFSSGGFTGKTVTVAAPAVVLSKVTTNAVTTVKDAKGVLLYKGKITATNVDDLTVSKLYTNFETGTSSAGNISQDFQRIYLYQVNADGSETKLDDETSLGATYVSFSGFNLNIPKGLSNGVYFTVRGDVKTTPTGTTTYVYLNGTSSNYTVKDSDNTALTSTQFSIDSAKSAVATVATVGTYTLDIDTTDSDLSANKNVLAGGIVKVAKIKATAQKEAAIIKDLVIKNGGTATGDTAATAYIYKDAAMTQLVGSADFATITAGSDYRALLQSLNVEIPTTGTTYLYVGVLVKGIDYSASPSADSTATAGQTIIITIPDNSGSYITKVEGKSTGTTIDNPTFGGTAKTATVLGATMSNITSDFASALLADGTARDIFSFKVTAPASTNVDYNGDPLGIGLGAVKFNVALTSGITLSNYIVQRVGGAEFAAYNADNAAASTTASYFIIDFGKTYDVHGTAATSSDWIVKPGETATYVVKATIAGTAAANSLQTTIETVDTNVNFTHRTGTTGTQGANLAAKNPLLAGISAVRGGTLSN